MTTLQTSCKACGKEYDLTRDDLVKGPSWYRVCPSWPG
jgi:hypothetical protein